MQNQFADSSLIFPPCKLISYSASASTRKHLLSQGGLETPSLAVITLSSLTASQPAYKTLPFSPAGGAPLLKRNGNIQTFLPPRPAPPPAEERKSCFSSPPSPFTSLLIQYFPSLLNRRERGQDRLLSDPFLSVLFNVNTSSPPSSIIIIIFKPAKGSGGRRLGLIFSKKNAENAGGRAFPFNAGKERAGGGGRKGGHQVFLPWILSVQPKAASAALRSSSGELAGLRDAQYS